MCVLSVKIENREKSSEKYDGENLNLNKSIKVIYRHVPCSYHQSEGLEFSTKMY